jgi:hypothetical protein
MNLYEIAVQSFPILVVALGLVGALAHYAPKITPVMWGLISVACGGLIGLLGGYIAFQAIANGGDSRIGIMVLGGFALGTTWFFIKLLQMRDSAR